MRELIEPEIRQAVGRVLDRKHCTLWRDWDIKNAESREKAIDWAVDFYTELEEELLTS